MHTGKIVYIQVVTTFSSSLRISGAEIRRQNINLTIEQKQTFTNTHVTHTYEHTSSTIKNRLHVDVEGEVKKASKEN